MKNRSFRGFTLIELLVVIAIIAILAAILFPVFASAREKARQVACLSNEDQLGLAFQQYIQDYDEQWPAGNASAANWTGGGVNQNPGCGWAGEIYPYLKSSGVFNCPDDPATAQPGTGVKLSYAYNQNFSVPSGTQLDAYGDAVCNGLADGKLNAPASTVLLFEMTEQGAGSLISPNDNWANPPPAGFGGGSFVYASPSGNGLDWIGTSAATWWAEYETGQMGGAPDEVYSGSDISIISGISEQSSHNSSCTVWPYQGVCNTMTDHQPGGGGMSNYLMSDGHCKFINGNFVSPGATAVNPNQAENATQVTLPDNLGTFYTAAGTGNLSPFTVTFSPV